MRPSCLRMAAAKVVLLVLTASGFAGDTHWQVPAGNWGDGSSWTNGEPSSLDNAYIGNGGEVSIDQPGEACISVFLGKEDYESGTINLVSGELSAANTVQVGYSGTGTLLHSGGTNAVAATLYLAYDSGSSGRYELSGTGELSAAFQYVGRYGTGTFLHSGGTNTISGTLFLAYGLGSSGRYELSGTGELSAEYQHVGRYGTGTFVQTGGTNTIRNTLYLQTGGTYELRGTGVLTAGREIRIGADSGAGRLEWFGDGLTTPTMTLGSPGTLALGFDFEVGSLLDGSLFHGSTLEGLDLAALEVTNGATATHANFASAAVGKLVVGTGTGSGTYGLQDGSLSAGWQYVGDSGTGVLSQSGGTNTISDELYLGYTSDGNGTYELSGSSNLSASDQYIGYSGTGILVQTGGTNTVSGGLYVAHQPGSSGTYQLSQSGAISAADQYIGEQGTGTLTQTGGTNVISGGLYLAHQPGSSGTYELSQSGELSASNQYIGHSGGGTFLHSGGTNAVAGTLYLAYEPGSSGRYELSGTGELSAVDQYVSRFGTGTFAQTGGTNVISGTLFIQGGGTYELGSTGVLTAGGEIRIGADSGAGRLEWFGDALTTPTITLGSSGTLALGFDFQMDSLLGGELFHGSTLDGLELGTLEVTNGAAATHGYDNSVGLGKLRLGTSTGAGTYSLESGALSAGAQHVGDSGTGVLSQVGGTNTISGELYLGYGSPSSGTYELSGTGRLSAPEVYVGYEGTGSFDHSGGDAAALSRLYVGYGPGGSGTYSLNGTGALAAADEYIGKQGAGTVVQTGGTHTVSNDFYLGYDPSGSGTYELSQSGELSASNQYIGHSGGGTFLHSGGTNAVAGTLYLALELGSSGRYELSGNGQLSATDEYVGGYGASTFAQTGGTNTASGSLHIQRGGTYSLSGTAKLSAASQYVGGSGEGGFTHTGGTNTVSQSLFVGQQANSHGTYELSGDGQLFAGSVYVGYDGTGRFTHAGGRNSILESLYLGNSRLGEGRYELSGAAELYADSEYVGYGGVGEFIQTGGINRIWESLYLGSDWRARGTYRLTAGTLAIRTGADSSLAVGVSDGTGTFYLGHQSGTGTIHETGSGGGVDLIVHGRATFLGSGTFRGWGTVDLTGTLQNNGRVVADGYGTDRTLDLSSFSAVTNDDSVRIVQGDDTTAGWYAQDHGKLVLPAFSVAAGTGAYNWGEDPGDGSIELVNSVRIVLANVTSGGSFSIDLLAPDHSDMPLDTTGAVVGAWSFSPPDGFAMDSADLTFRYDAALAGSLGIDENELSVYHFTDSNWVDVTSGIDTTNKWIGADGVASFSTFAVGFGIGIPSQWQPVDGTSYHNSANWSNNTVPNGLGAVANFLERIEGNATVTVDETATVGSIKFRSPQLHPEYGYTVQGPATITISASGGPQIIVERGDHTITTPLSIVGDLSVDTWDSTGLTLDPAAAALITGELTKQGPGALVLAGNLLLGGEIHVNQGILQVGKGLLAWAGSTPRAINIGDGATLRASGYVNGRVIGGPTSTLEATGAMDVGDSGNPDGYDFQGKLVVGPHTVGLMDTDLAKVFRGATIAGGTLGSVMGIELQSGTVFQRTIKGPGTIAGNVRFNGSSVAGISLAQPLVFPGVVEGLGTFSFAQFTGLLRLGASPVYIPSSGGNQFQGTLLAEIWGPNAGQARFDEAAQDIVGEADPQGYHQFGIFDGTALGGAPTDTLGGTLQIDVFGGYVPLPGDEFRIFEAVAIPLPPELGFPGDEFPAGNFTGWFDTVVLDSALTGDWFWRWEYPDHSTDLGPAVGGRPSQDLLLSATLTIVPEPGTLVLLLSGALGLLAWGWRRRRRR